MIRLPVLTIADARPTGRPPMVVLAGGPGNSALDQASGFADHFLGDGRDIILVETRGAGYAEPSLDCPEVHAVHRQIFTLDDPDTEQAMADDALRACRQRLIDDGVDLAAYTTQAAALDLIALRHALDVPLWDVLGPSYGGRLALELARVDAAGIAHLILDSAVPPDVPQGGSAIAERAQACSPASRSPAIRPWTAQPRRPTSITTLGALVTRFDEHPIATTGTDGSALMLTGRDIFALAFFLLYRTDTIPLVPALIDSPEVLAPQLAPTVIDSIVASFDAISIGMSLSVSCSDHAGIEPADQFEGTLVGYRAATTIWQFFPTPDACTIWDVPPAAPSARALIPVDTPTLILSGALDPIADPADAHRIAATLPHATLVTFANRGHGALATDACTATLVTGFLDGNGITTEQCDSDVPTVEPRA